MASETERAIVRAISDLAELKHVLDSGGKTVKPSKESPTTNPAQQAVNKLL